jgi:hypothetical protein
MSKSEEKVMNMSEVKELLFNPDLVITQYNKVEDKKKYEADFNNAIKRLSTELNKESIELGAAALFAVFTAGLVGGSALTGAVPSATVNAKHVLEIYKMLQKNIKKINEATKMNLTNSRSLMKIIKGLST